MWHWFCVVAIVCVMGVGISSAGEFPSETNYDTTVHPDEALVNLRIRNSRWPDCYNFETLIRDIFRIEGVDDTPDATEAKAMALWTWLLALKSTGGSRVFEGNPYGDRKRCVGDKDKDQIEVRRGDKQMLVYGLHECGGMSRTMVHLWRSAGFLGYQEASRGHSTAALRFPDKDGIWRMHSFNPQGHSYYWNPRDNRVGTRRLPVMRGVEYKTFLPPLEHTLRTSLRPGEVVVRKWENDGYIQKTERMLSWAGKVGNNKRHMQANVAGQEDQTLSAITEPATFRVPLCSGSKNGACSPVKTNLATLHPDIAGKSSVFIYRLASPYVAVEAVVEAELLTTAADDLCRLAFSTDGGKTWTVFFDKKNVGAESIKIELGQKRYWDKTQKSITSYYDFLVKAEFKTSAAIRGVGMNKFKVTVHRQLNMRCLPNLMPGKNVIKIEADALKPELALDFQLDYEVNGQAKSVQQTIASFPHYLLIDIDGIPAEKLATPHYIKGLSRKSFNLAAHPLRMRAMRMKLVKLAAVKPDESMSAAAAEPFFKKVYPNPTMSNKRMAKKEKIPAYESQVSGFFPQIPRKADQPQEPLAYYNWLVKNLGTSDAMLPQAPAEVKDPVAWCIKKFPSVHCLHKLGFCNVFAHFQDKRAIPILLKTWKKAPRWRPGDRYIPDVIALLGDSSMVPLLVEPLKRLRFDYRVHIARALGILGGEEAKKTLLFLVEKDPNISVRGEARRALEVLAKQKP